MLWTGFIPRRGGGRGALLASGTVGRRDRSPWMEGHFPSLKWEIIIHWAAETIWWNAGPVLQRTPCSESGLYASSMALVSAIIVPSLVLRSPDSQEAPSPFISFFSHDHPKSRLALRGSLCCCWSEGINAGGRRWLPGMASQVSVGLWARYMTSLGPGAAPPQPRKCSPRFTGGERLPPCDLGRNLLRHQAR